MAQHPDSESCSPKWRGIHLGCTASGGGIAGRIRVTAAHSPLNGPAIGHCNHHAGALRSGLSN